MSKITKKEIDEILELYIVAKTNLQLFEELEAKALKMAEIIRQQQEVLKLSQDVLNEFGRPSAFFPVEYERTQNAITSLIGGDENDK